MGLIKTYYGVTSRTALLVFVLAVAGIVYLNGVNGPLSIIRFEQLTAGLPLLDLVWNYSPAYAYELLDGYGEQGRAAYTNILLYVDTILPALYGFGFGLLLARLIRAAAPRSSGLRILSWVPLAAMLADYAENAIIWMMLGAYPERMNSLATAASALTMVKTALTQASLGLILLLALGALIAKLRRSRARSRSAGASG